MRAEQVYQRIAAARLVPVIRVADRRRGLDLVTRLFAAGLDIVEITTSIPGWAEVVCRLRAERPEACIGVGTVTSAELARQAISAGAQFCVSPRLAPLARAELDGTDVPLIEGGLSPTEVLTAAEHGVAKLFPAHIGGPRYLRSLLSVAPGARIMPTGGIPVDEVHTWLNAGAFAVGVGGDLSGERASAEDIRARVREVTNR